MGIEGKKENRKVTRKIFEVNTKSGIENTRI